MSENIETIGIGFPWEELPVGRKFKTQGRTITETDIVNFISVTGMLEVLFTNVEFLHQAGFEGRLVPGGQVFCFAEGLLFQTALQGVGVAFLGMELDIKGPTFAGDTVHVECEVIESRPSKGKPGMGLVRTRNQVVKQDGTVVMVYTPLRLCKGRANLAG
ncbi:MaoC family dehydratase [Stutzerimonas kunmingensis]|jgi:acyl dehydratase|uniref:MaoC family dehydratase n=1 Tax=Stutzerimonas kunmingensis TaxID=1211807 RepID=UPI0026593AF4|nr:MaoC/PaaZ C-terminal domain-containing protein [Stutzerimonas kunmingensis]MCW8158408.1 acyl dehydratase [Stutzerimonas stutzeri]